MTRGPAAPAIFVAGAGTEIGKTHVTAALVRHLRGRGRAVRALKPVASGVPEPGDPAFAGSDTARLLAAQGIAPDAAAVAACSPWRFTAPLAPDRAARLEGRALALPDLVGWCAARIAEGMARGETVLIEGVGGLMSPVTDAATGLDWLRALGTPALLVSGSYLGAISHALTARETLCAHGAPPLAIVVSESPGAPTPPEAVAEGIARHAAEPVLVLGWGAPCPAALADLL